MNSQRRFAGIPVPRGTVRRLRSQNVVAIQMSAELTNTVLTG